MNLVPLLPLVLGFALIAMWVYNNSTALKPGDIKNGLKNNLAIILITLGLLKTVTSFGEVLITVARLEG